MSTVAGSTMESEYMGAYPCGQEVIRCRNTMSELQLSFVRASPFFMDAQAAIDALKNPVFHARTKHIAIKFHWLRQHVEGKLGKTLRIIHVRSIDMVADILTKMTTQLVWNTLIDRLMGDKIISSDEIIRAQERPRGKPL